MVVWTVAYLVVRLAEKKVGSMAGLWVHQMAAMLAIQMVVHSESL